VQELFRAGSLRISNGAGAGGLFKHFIGERRRARAVTCEVIRQRVTDPTFGSIAIVRRAALELGNNLKTRDTAISTCCA
jgi:hypothetical protein